VRLRFLVVLSALLAAWPFGARGQDPASTASIVVAHYNVQNYLVMDRYLRDERRAAPASPKPEKSIAALVAIIVKARPDLLHVAEMGPPDQFADFRKRLKEAGLEYPEAEYVQGADKDRHLALLSRFPIISRQSRTDLSFELNGVREPVQRGFLDVTVRVTPTFEVRVLGAHLKSRRPVPQGEAMLRRHESLLLRKHIDSILTADPGTHLLLLGDLNDTKNEPTMKEIIGVRGSPTHMADLWLTDPLGDRWTHYWDTADEYARIDYLLVSPALFPRVDFKKSGIDRTEGWNVASDHRLLFATLRTNERKRPAKTAPTEAPAPPIPDPAEEEK
jgi:endonuclease/exonuclease/phosphatase family metal-dependent hydrolase